MGVISRSEGALHIHFLSTGPCAQQDFYRSADVGVNTFVMFIGEMRLIVFSFENWRARRLFLLPTAPFVYFSVGLGRYSSLSTCLLSTVLVIS